MTISFPLKYLSKRFREFLLNISDLSLEEQHKRLDAEFLEWKGDGHQTDDIIVIGVKVV
jgi:hypothetical protein